MIDQIKTQKIRHKEAFSLLELSITVITISIVSIAGLNQYIKFMRSQEMKRANNTALSIYSGMQMYHTKYGSYPDVFCEGIGAAPCLQNALGKFAPSLPPESNNQYFFYIRENLIVGNPAAQMPRLIIANVADKLNYALEFHLYETPSENNPEWYIWMDDQSTGDSPSWYTNIAQ